MKATVLLDFGADPVSCHCGAPGAPRGNGCDDVCDRCLTLWLDAGEPQMCPCQPATVHRATLWDGVVDTFQTEAELNGYRPAQGALL
ncbi:MAG: hypothetical protein AB7T37_13955 [Dehalococcoidia bacterium]